MATPRNDIWYLADFFSNELLEHPLRKLNTCARFKTLAKDLFHVDDLDHAKLSAAVLLLPPPANAPTARTSWSALGPHDGNLGDWFTEGSTDFKPAWLNSAPTGREVVQGFPVSALLAYSYVHMSRYYCAHHDVYCLIRGLWADGRIDNMKDALALLLTIIDLHPAPSTVLYTQNLPYDAAIVIAYILGWRTIHSTRHFYVIQDGASRVIGRAFLKWYRVLKWYRARAAAARVAAVRVIQKRLVEWLLRPGGRQVRRMAVEFYKAVEAMRKPADDDDAAA